MPNQSGHIYLVTNRHGQYRLITVSRPTINGEMYGIMTTLLAGRGSLLTPIASPIAFVPLQAIAKPTSAASRRPSEPRDLRAAPQAHDRRAVCAVPAGLTLSRNANSA